MSSQTTAQLEEFLKQFFLAGHHTRELHPFVAQNHPLRDEQNQPLFRNGAPVANRSWRPQVLPPSWIETETAFAFIPGENVRHLFIGTFPPPSVTFGYGELVGFFYGSDNNLMWRVMPRVTGRDDLVGRDFFTHFNIGVTDIIVESERVRFSGNDDALSPLRFNKVDDILMQYPLIDRLYFSSGSAAFRWTCKVLKQGRRRFPSMVAIRRSGIPENVFGRNILCKVLYSPSPMATQRIYNSSKTHFYEGLCRYHGIEGVNQNNAMARLLAPFHNCAPDELYRIFQWAKALRDIEGLVRTQLLETIDALEN